MIETFIHFVGFFITCWFCFETGRLIERKQHYVWLCERLTEKSTITVHKKRKNGDEE